MMVAFAFHQGKLAVQNRAGMAAEAARALEAGWIGTIIRSADDVHKDVNHRQA